MTKLLFKPLKTFIIFALVLLCCSIPVYFYSVEYLWTDELDENNLIIKYRIENFYKNNSIEETDIDKTISNWQVVQPGIQITAAEENSSLEVDKFYFITQKHNYSGAPETDRYRGLASSININGKPYHLTIETNVEDANGIFTSVGRVTIFFFILLAAGFIILNQRITKNIWKPFNNTLGKLKLFDISKQDEIQFEKTNIEEFEILNAELSKLITRSRSDYQIQKKFIENAAHEIQTPLALLRSKIDILLQTESVTNEQLKIINSISIPLSRVSRIHKNILLLSGLENQQFVGIENITINEVVKENLELLSDYLNEKNITIQLSASEILTVHCNKLLCDSLVNNLLVNAIRHSKLNHIEIEVKNKSLTIMNDGVEELNKDSIFTRFATSADGSGGTGLGLAIVKEICNRYHWDITYSFINQKHKFSVAF